MIVVIFESVILVITLLLFRLIQYPFFGEHVIMAISLGVLIGLGDFFLTWFFVKKFERSRRFMFEYHKSYSKMSVARRLSWKPVLIAFGEELFFRGLLTSVIGWLGANLLFAGLHATQFTDRVFTAVIIFLYGVTFLIPLWVTGSLVGSVLAHFVFTLCRINYFPKKLSI